MRRYDNVNWMYTNYPCTEVETKLDGARREFKSTIRGCAQRGPRTRASLAMCKTPCRFTALADGCDNPSDPVTLTDIQEARRVQLTYTKRSTILIEYDVQATSCYSYFTGGRNFLFTGLSSSVCAPPAAPPSVG